jgi:arylamine N-acetyltransferase
MARSSGAGEASDPNLAPELVDRVLSKLGLSERPSLEVAGLNSVLAAYCGSISFDNIQKRIWLAGEQTTPLTGGDPTEFFENWLAHGTGGTCWPINGGLYALIKSLGFKARRIAGRMILDEWPGTNHGSVLVTLDGIDYFVDANIGCFRALSFVPGTPASTGDGIHDISAVPIKGSFDIIWYQGHDREEPLRFRPEPEHDPVDHAFFLERYDRTIRISPFNDSLFICRRFPDLILTLGRKNKITVAADGTMTTTEITDDGRKRVLVEELEISEEIVGTLPPDVPGGYAFEEIKAERA